MKIIKISIVSLVFILTFVFSLVELMSFYDDKTYYETSARLFEYQDKLEDYQISDFEKFKRLLTDDEVEDDYDFCNF